VNENTVLAVIKILFCKHSTRDNHASDTTNELLQCTVLLCLT